MIVIMNHPNYRRLCESLLRHQGIGAPCRTIVGASRQKSFSTQSLRSTSAAVPPSFSSSAAAPPSQNDGSILWMEPIHVLGAGSVGLLMAASLRVAFPSFPIRLLLREHHRAKQRREGEEEGRQKKKTNDRPDVLVNLIQNRRLRTVNVPSQIISPSFRPRRKFKNILLATKAYQAVEALDSIRHCLQFGSSSDDDSFSGGGVKDDNRDSNKSHGAMRTQIVLLCNGAMAARDDILAHFVDLDPSNLHMALTTHGAYRELVANDSSSTTTENDYESSSASIEDDSTLMMDVVHAGLGRLDFPPSLSAWTPLFDRAGLQAHTLTDKEMNVQLWCKLAANCLINPLTALHQCTNGEVVQCPEWEEMLRAVPEEVAQVAKCRLGVIEADDIDASMLRAFCKEVVASTRDNRSSMYQDVKAGRRTEIDAINGYVVRLGEENGINVSANRSLYTHILQLSPG